MISIKKFLIEHFQNKSVLRLTLHHQAFAVMITGEKNFEFRQPSQWMKNRLFDKRDKPRHYDYILFVNGYGDDLPFFLTSYGGATQLLMDLPVLKFSTGFNLTVKKGHFAMLLPQVVAFGNATDDETGDELHFLADLTTKQQ